MEECWIDFDEFLREALAQGLQPPFHVAVLSKHGGLLFCRFFFGGQDQEPDADMLTTFNTDAPFDGPVTLVLIDRDGSAKLGSLDRLSAC